MRSVECLLLYLRPTYDHAKFEIVPYARQSCDRFLCVLVLVLWRCFGLGLDIWVDVLVIVLGLHYSSQQD